MPAVQQRGPGPGPPSPALQRTPGGGVVGSVARQVPLPPGTRDLARRPPPELRREVETGRAGAGERRGHGRGLGSRGAAVTRTRGPRCARGRRRHFSAAKPRPAPPPPAPHSRGGARRFATACGDLAARCLRTLRWVSRAPTWALSREGRACEST